MNKIADFSESELWIIRTTLQERYRAEVATEFAEAEMRLRPSDRELTLCPVIVWQANTTHFMIAKAGDRRYRCQFYYRNHQQFGTGIEEYDDLGECVVTLLQVEADHESRRQGLFPN